MDDRNSALLLATVTPMVALSGLAAQLLWYFHAPGRWPAALLAGGVALGGILAFLPTRVAFRKILLVFALLLAGLLVGRLSATAVSGAPLDATRELAVGARALALYAGLGLVWLTNRRRLTLRPRPAIVPPPRS